MAGVSQLKMENGMALIGQNLRPIKNLEHFLTQNMLPSVGQVINIE
ncbi:MAG: hypothetical protein ACKVJQ_04615 [Alphaproteobacteria bacterium]